MGQHSMTGHHPYTNTHNHTLIHMHRGNLTFNLATGMFGEVWGNPHGHEGNMQNSTQTGTQAQYQIRDNAKVSYLFQLMFNVIVSIWFPFDNFLGSYFVTSGNGLFCWTKFALFLKCCGNLKTQRSLIDKLIRNIHQ